MLVEQSLSDVDSLFVYGSLPSSSFDLSSVCLELAQLTQDKLKSNSVSTKTIQIFLLPFLTPPILNLKRVQIILLHQFLISDGTKKFFEPLTMVYLKLSKKKD